MKRALLFLGLAGIIVLALPPTVLTQTPSDLSVHPERPEVVPDRYIVQLKAGVEPGRAAQRLAEAHGLRAGQMYRYVLNGFAAFIPAVRVELVRRDPDVLAVEPDLAVHVAAQTLPTGINRIDADLNSVAKINGLDERVNVDIAIIDTGSGPHSDLNVFFRTDCVDESGLGFLFGITCLDQTDCPTCGLDGNGHGTHVAGIAAALDNAIGVVGVAPGARIWSVAVLDSRGSGRLSWVIAGIDWVTQHAAQIEVANMSLAWVGNSSAARTAIQNSVAQGVVYVVAAANSSKDIYGTDKTFGTSDDFEPAAYPEVATISALADSDGAAGGSGAATTYGPDDTLATFSNFSTNVVAGNPVSSPGAGIDVAAPGVSIFSTYLNDGYATLSGTSMASPHVAGAVGLYIAAHGRATSASQVAFIRQQIINAAQLQTSWGPATTGDPDNNHEGLVYVGDAPPPAPPTAPSGLVATAVSSSQINLAWTDNATDESGFKIERCTGSACVNFAQIAQVGANVTGYSDAGLAAATTYTYRVRAFNAGGNSNFSNNAQATTAPAPASITLTATGYKVKGGLQKANLSWSGAGSATVDIYRNGVKIVTTDNDGFFTDNINKKGGGSYTYQVCELGSTAACSNTATVTF